jgi:hypothetical protein
LSEWLYNTNCDQCGSRDNLAVYDDHVWCFGCRFYENRKSINPKLINNIHRKKNNNDVVSLPDDFDYHIPPAPLKWLTDYGITAQEIQRHRMGWSEFKKYLVFPVYDPAGNLLMWQGRYYGDNPDHPKYITRGAKNVLHILGEHGILVLVEDLVSAIKIARKHKAMPLWGSSINLDLLIRLHSVTNEFAIWLDHNMYDEARKAANRALQWYDRVVVIETPLDPKCYTPAEIQTIIGNEVK